MVCPSGAKRAHLDVLAIGRQLRTREKIAGEFDGAEMLQLPHLPAFRVRGPFQGYDKPHGEYGVDATK